MDCLDFLGSANDCIARFSASQEEIELRNAMSRAYYWAYHRAVDLASLIKLPAAHETRNQGLHKQLATRYKNSGTKSLAAISGSLEAAHKMRCLADYNLDDKLTVSLVTQQIERCKGICHRLDQIQQAACAAQSAP